MITPNPEIPGDFISELKEETLTWWTSTFEKDVGGFTDIYVQVNYKTQSEKKESFILLQAPWDSYQKPMIRAISLERAQAAQWPGDVKRNRFAESDEEYEGE